MSYIIKRQKTFTKDFHKVTLNDTEFNRLIAYIALLQEGKALPKEANEHALQGEWKDTREFHIGSDMLVVYMYEEENIIKLLRIGTHAQIFK
ncbi:type II toxin-antitoxin system YafQ family toxin [Campylobacter upsaliensis]|uniref:type II toxin-antitoxin system YafQ family toxin n=1 Tax=Campylobacter upsaliensis TaxID=28080 RepID=UPI002B3BD354|nr:type II toxin-antitoxin system YafQ family toxin [Campylobacter upsaliensis]MEB2827691.1 type II toxin-antitoxin system YafQ family toxin [Campylobacter upsaliensis]